MCRIRISDVTMKQAAEGFSLSFKEKIELAKLLDRLGTDCIELEGIRNPRIDSLRIKSIAAAVHDSTVAVPVELEPQSVSAVWAALQQAKHPRLQVCASVSPVQMEYLFHRKPDAMLTAIRQTVAACRAVCPDVEFVADDATRSEMAFLQQAVTAAMESGATTVTLCDTAGTMLPGEFAQFLRKVREGVSGWEQAALGVSCNDTLNMADACAIAAAMEGATELKTAAYPLGSASLANVAKLISAKTDAIGAGCGIRITQLSRIIDQITWMCQTGKHKPGAETADADSSGIYLTAHDDLAAVSAVVEKLGYDLSEEDLSRVYDAFCQIAGKKEQVSSKELDAIVASAATGSS